MSRKDFELLARTIKDMRRDRPAQTWRQDINSIAERIATALDGHSATFDKERFLKACGVEAKETV